MPSFGALDAPLLVVGLAPGVRGANRTGRPFTGDYAGVLLYNTLLKFGFATGDYQERPDDGLTLNNCRDHQRRALRAARKTCRRRRKIKPATPSSPRKSPPCPSLRAILTLGTVAHLMSLRALGIKPAAVQIRTWRDAPAPPRTAARQQLPCVALQHEHTAPEYRDV